MARRKNATRVWLVLAAAMLVVATGLTLYVTAVNGRVLSPIEIKTDLGPPPVTYKNGKMEIDQAALEKMKADNDEAQKRTVFLQTVAVYASQPNADLARKVKILFSSDRKGNDAWIAFNIPQGAVVKILLNNVMNKVPPSDVAEKDCKAVGNEPFARSDRPGGEFAVSVTPVGADFGPSYSLVDPGRPDTAFTVTCKLKNIFQRHTFTQRTAAFVFDDAMAGVGPYAYQPLAAKLQGFAPLPSETLDFSGIDGADQFWFLGGHQDQSLSDFEFTRVLALSESAHLIWVDVILEQLRDLLLVVIGTLIALGVTAFIEAIRPRIDGTDELADEGERIVAEFPDG